MLAMKGNKMDKAPALMVPNGLVSETDSTAGNMIILGRVELLGR